MERCAVNPAEIITTYEGQHCHEVPPKRGSSVFVSMAHVYNGFTPETE